MSNRPSYVSLSKGLPTAVVAQRGECDKKATAMLYCLKQYKNCGRIKNYQQERQLIASRYGISARTLDKYVGLLEGQGLVVRHYRSRTNAKSYDLVLRASKRVANAHGTSAKRFYQVEFTTFRDLVNKIEALQLQEHQNTCTYKVKDRHRGNASDNRIIHPSDWQPKRSKRAPKGHDIAQKAASEVSHFIDFVSQVANAGKPLPTSPFADTSLEGLKSTINRKSKTSVSRRLKKLQAAGLVQVQAHLIPTDYTNVSRAEYAWLRESVLKNDFSYRRRGPAVYKVLPSHLVFAPSIVR